MNPVTLTHESIEGYGQLLHDTIMAPTFDGAEFAYTADFFKTNFEGPMTAILLVGHKREIKPEHLECHGKTVEILFEMENDAVIFLAKTGEDGGPGEPEAFYFRQGQAVALNAGIWHWVPYPVGDASTKTLVIYKEGTGQNDFVMKDL